MRITLNTEDFDTIKTTTNGEDQTTIANLNFIKVYSSIKKGLGGGGEMWSAKYFRNVYIIVKIFYILIFLND